LLMIEMPSGGRRRAAGVAMGLALLSALSAAPAWADRRTESSGAYERGFERFERGDVRGARIELMRALQANPNNPLARLLQARVMLELGSGVAAQTEIEKAIAAGVPRDKTRHLMAYALVLQREFDRALREADAAQVPPQFASYAARMRGRAHLGLEQNDRANAEFERALQLAPNDVEALADLARFRSLQGQAAAGEKLVDRALAVEPTSARALLLKGDLVRSRAGLERALPYFNQALEVDPNNVEALLERASTLGDLRRDAAARADLKKVYSLVPDQPLALYLEAVLEARAGRYAQANALMTRTRGILNRYPPALLLQGMLAFQLNDMQQADEFLGKVVAQMPQNDLARKLYASVQLRKGDTGGAIETLRPIVAGNRADARTLALMGSAHARRGEFNLAQQFLERAARAAPNEPSVRTQLAMTRAAQGNAAGASAELQAVLREDPNSLQALMLTSLLGLRQGDNRAALGAANRIVQAYPQLPIGYNMRGAAQLGLGDRRAAEASFRTAIQKKPDFIEARRNLAQLLIASGRADAGRQELLRILEVDRNDASAMVSLARLAGNGGRDEEQIDWLRRAAAAKPLLLVPRAELARVYVEAGQPNRAITEARSIERDFATNLRALETAGLIYMAAGRPQEAESAFNRLVARAGTSVPARVQLARAQAAQGRADDARRTLDQALTLTGQDLLPVYVDLIGIESRARRVPQAVALVERVRRAYPRSNVADQLLGDVRLNAGQVPQAIAAYQAARKIRFDRPVASRLSGAYMRARQPAQALAVMTAYRKANPNDRVAAAQTADIYLTTRQYRPAVAIYEGLRRQGLANDPVILNNLAWSYHQLRDKRARPLAEQALRLAPRAPSIQDTLGMILVETRADPKRGLALLQAAVRAEPRDPNFRLHLAQAYQANDRPNEAVRELQTALRMPGFDQAPRARQLLAQWRRT